MVGEKKELYLLLLSSWIEKDVFKKFSDHLLQYGWRNGLHIRPAFIRSRDRRSKSDERWERRTRWKRNRLLVFLSVVNDIVGAMFHAKFVEELFRPQELYPKKAVKHIFEKLAHSSIMRLNEASMDKVRTAATNLKKDFVLLALRSNDHVGEISNHALSKRIGYYQGHLQSRQFHEKTSSKYDCARSSGQGIYCV